MYSSFLRLYYMQLNISCYFLYTNEIQMCSISKAPSPSLTHSLTHSTGSLSKITQMISHHQHYQYTSKGPLEHWFTKVLQKWNSQPHPTGNGTGIGNREYVSHGSGIESTMERKDNGIPNMFLRTEKGSDTEQIFRLGTFEIRLTLSK